MKCWKTVLIGLVLGTVVSVVFMGYFCFDSHCALTHEGVTPSYRNDVEAYKLGLVSRHTFQDNEIKQDIDVNLDEEDVFVFLHIQKTGGTTFGQHLVDDLDVDPPCFCYRRKKKHCDCLTKKRKIWLFSRFSTGWSCGLHADWTELTACVDATMNKKEKARRKRRYLYMTILRNPVKRFLSEWLHVRRGATWKAAQLKCNDRSATLEEVPFCFDEVDWSNVSLKDFINCPHNLAINRQTRMLANLSLVNCYNTTGMTTEDRNSKMLRSAKDNLRDMAFFGMTEYQNLTQILFEETFQMKFIEDFMQYTPKKHRTTGEISQKDIDRIIDINKNDILLYQYAKDLFLQRVDRITKEDDEDVENNETGDDNDNLIVADKFHDERKVV